MHRRWVAATLEALASFAAAALLALACTNIKVDPLQRIGQISGLASIQVRFLLFALPLVAALLVAAKVRRGAWFPMTSRLVCAALAGLASGFVAGGIIVALRGTPFCLNANAGDSDIIVMWANALKRGEPSQYPPVFYPPMFPWVLRYYMDVVDLPAVFALKHLQIIGSAIVGPLAYLSWRLVLRPGWALAIGVIAALVIIDPYKPYGNTVLIVLVPIAIRFFQVMRDAPDRHWHELVKAGVLFGVVLGLLCLVYSGWFRWAAPGLVLAAITVFPWRRAAKKAALFGGVTLLLVAAVTWNYVTGVVSLSAKVSEATGGKGTMIVDDYVYFDVVTDPTYFAMWKGDLPGTTTVWPPPGELAGVGLFTLVLFAGLGIAVALGRRRTDVITLGWLLAAVWFQRFWQAHYMFKTKLVQLWPRTTLMIVYLCVIFAGYAIFLWSERAAKRAEPDSPLRSPSGLVGAVVALTFVLGSMASSIADRYMPYSSLPRAPGWLAFVAHDQYRLSKLPPAPPTPPAPPAPAPAPETPSTPPADAPAPPAEPPAPDAPK